MRRKLLDTADVASEDLKYGREGEIINRLVVSKRYDRGTTVEVYRWGEPLTKLQNMLRKIITRSVDKTAKLVCTKVRGHHLNKCKKISLLIMISAGKTH